MLNNRYYLFPFNLIPAGSRIIIYGIGEIGRAYVEQIKATGYCYIALLVDKNYEEINRYYQYKVHSKYDINSQSYDFLIIASDQYQKAICDDLLSIGVDKNKIVTHDAIILGRGLDIIAAAVTKSNYTGEVCHLHLKELGDYRFYTEDTETYQKKCSRNYFIEGTCNVRIVENGIIWSSEWDTIDNRIRNFGGIFTADGRYADGIRKHSDISYEDTRKALYSDETVVYGGHLMNHYGHTITECISRMWWHLENPGGRYKYAFTIEKSRRYNFLEFFLLFGLREEDIILVEEPTRFKSVIVPECAFHIKELWFKDKAVNIYNYLRDSVKPAGYDKVYLTRTALRNTDLSLIGEEYFEDYYRSMGYEIISPEQLSIPEQIAIMAGAKKIACTGGTLQHQILFSQDGIDITVLNRSKDILDVYFVVNQLRKAKCAFIDVSANFLLDTRVHTSCLLMPSRYWIEYASDQADFPPARKWSDEEWRRYAMDYIEQWTNIVTELEPQYLKAYYSKYKLSDIIMNLSKYFLENELDESKKKMIFDSLNQ